MGDRTNDPDRNSLRLLPSGPDRVGEKPVRRRSPAGTIADQGGVGARPKTKIRRGSSINFVVSYDGPGGSFREEVVSCDGGSKSGGISGVTGVVGTAGGGAGASLAAGTS